ncbi:HAD domain-containing protein [Marinobacter vinifirmus]
MFTFHLFRRTPSNEPPKRGSPRKATLPIKEDMEIEACCNGNVLTGPTLFYDVDGVLHPNDTGNLSCADVLTSITSQIPGLQLVMSSNWRETMDLEFFQRIFPKEIVNRTVGFTPVLSAPPYRRQREIEVFTSYFGISRFICIDDQERLYEPGWPNLHLIERSRGLDECSIEKIVRYFSEGSQ